MAPRARIYTKTGDAGQTSLGNGQRVSKTHPRVVAYGAVDELNSVIGMARTHPLPEPLEAWLLQIQNELFVLEADLCMPPEPNRSKPDAVPRIEEKHATNLEGWIDELTGQLPPLKNFILPGGTAAAAALHFARTVCRRVEILLIELSMSESDAEQVTGNIVYLNRLSDLLFVMGRFCNDRGESDVVWRPE